MVLIYSSSLSAQETSRFIEVNGTSKIIAQADYIHFMIQIRNVAKTLEASRQQNVRDSDELVEIINQFRIAKEDWELSPMKFGKEYSYKPERKLVGYFSQVTVSVKLKSLDDYYAFITELSKNKFYEIIHSEYRVSDLLKYHKEATISAVKAAKEKAGYIAESMGVKVGKIIQIRELNKIQTYPNPFNKVSEMGSSQENISGRISISRSVSMKVELID